MSILGDAVTTEVAARGIDIDRAQIEKILLDAGVSSKASRGVPVRLRLRRLRVTGTKHFSETPGEPSTATHLRSAPIDLDWAPGDGVNGVGSEANLRGKSSVLHFALWALTGRSHLQADVISWVNSVTAEFGIDGVPLHVEFDVSEGTPSGTVEQQLRSGRVILGRFTGHAEFESLMGSVMLDRLRLDAISVFSKGIETEHAWPSYAAALTVHADKLDPIIGNENTLKTRILQMFVGTSWAAVDAQVATALNARQFERGEVDSQRRAVASLTATSLSLAEDRLMAAEAARERYDLSEPDVDAVFGLAVTATERGREAHDIELRLMTARNAEAEVRAHLRAEELRRQAAIEDSLARRLFNGMAPTMCPRCSTKVSAERYVAETIQHECSLCSSDLALHSHDQQPAPTDMGAGDSSSNEVGDSESDDEAVDPIQALRVAASEATEVVAGLQAAYQTADSVRTEAEAAAQTGRETLDSARGRLDAELELARAESALEALRAAADLEPQAPPVDDQWVVLNAAAKLTKRWVKEDQDPLLTAVSEAITSLARRFGSTNITSVTLKGNGNMEVHKGGAKTGYSNLTNGEKLRIKLAAVIALIEIGHRDGVGRHPGLLFVDSPAAEEIPEADLKTMLEAMTAVAEETDLQIVVATTHGPMLSNVLAPEQLLVATGNDFVW